MVKEKKTYHYLSELTLSRQSSEQANSQWVYVVIKFNDEIIVTSTQQLPNIGNSIYNFKPAKKLGLTDKGPQICCVQIWDYDEMLLLQTLQIGIDDLEGDLYQNNLSDDIKVSIKFIIPNLKKQENTENRLSVCNTLMEKTLSACNTQASIQVSGVVNDNGNGNDNDTENDKVIEKIPLKRFFRSPPRVYRLKSYKKQGNPEKEEPTACKFELYNNQGTEKVGNLSFKPPRRLRFPLKDRDSLKN